MLEKAAGGGAHKHFTQRHLFGLICSSLLLFSKLDEQMPCLPPPSSEAVAALVRELRAQLGMALFGVDVIINIHTHTLTVIDINIFPGTAAAHTPAKT